jgi:hypothetical protein
MNTKYGAGKPAPYRYAMTPVIQAPRLMLAVGNHRATGEPQKSEAGITAASLGDRAKDDLYLRTGNGPQN